MEAELPKDSKDLHHDSSGYLNQCWRCFAFYQEQFDNLNVYSNQCPSCKAWNGQDGARARAQGHLNRPKPLEIEMFKKGKTMETTMEHPKRNSPEHLANLSNAIKRSWQDPVIRRKREEGLRRYAKRSTGRGASGTYGFTQPQILRIMNERGLTKKELVLHLQQKTGFAITTIYRCIKGKKVMPQIREQVEEALGEKFEFRTVRGLTRKRPYLNLPRECKECGSVDIHAQGLCNLHYKRKYDSKLQVKIQSPNYFLMDVANQSLKPIPKQMELAILALLKIGNE